MDKNKNGKRRDSKQKRNQNDQVNDHVTDVLRDHDRPPNRQGLKARGAYPEISRTKLSELTRMHVSTITGILNGRLRPRLEVAVMIAEAIKVDVQELNRVLLEKQAEYAGKRR